MAFKRIRTEYPQVACLVCVTTMVREGLDSPGDVYSPDCDRVLGCSLQSAFGITQTNIPL